MIALPLFDQEQTMIVITHQPIFLPWPGFFFKAMKADCMVLLDDVQKLGDFLTRIPVVIVYFQFQTKVLCSRMNRQVSVQS